MTQTFRRQFSQSRHLDNSRSQIKGHSFTTPQLRTTASPHDVNRVRQTLSAFRVLPQTANLALLSARGLHSSLLPKQRLKEVSLESTSGDLSSKIMKCCCSKEPERPPNPIPLIVEAQRLMLKRAFPGVKLDTEAPSEPNFYSVLFPPNQRSASKSSNRPF